MLLFPLAAFFRSIIVTVAGPSPPGALGEATRIPYPARAGCRARETGPGRIPGGEGPATVTIIEPLMAEEGGQGKEQFLQIIVIYYKC